MSQSSAAKKARRVINKYADKIQLNVTLDIIEGMYRMPLWKRIKWASKIVLGIRRDSLYNFFLAAIYCADAALEYLLVELPKGKKNAKRSK